MIIHEVSGNTIQKERAESGFLDPGFQLVYLSEKYKIMKYEHADKCTKVHKMARSLVWLGLRDFVD